MKIKHNIPLLLSELLTWIEYNNAAHSCFIICGTILTNDYISHNSKFLTLMESITIFNWATLAMMISILSFMAKNYHDSRKAEKAIRNEVRDVRNDVGNVRNEVGDVRNEVGDVRNEVGDVRNEVRESEMRTRGEIHESERRTSGEIRELSNQLAELRGVLKGSGALPM